MINGPSGARSLRTLVLVLVVGLLSACGGSSGGGGIVAGGEIVFPAAGMNFADTTITVYGRGSAGASAVLVNGIPATSADGFASWRAPLVLQPGKNTIDLEVSMGGRSDLIASVVVHQGPELVTISKCSDVHGGVLVAYDATMNSLARIDLRDGTRKVLPLGTTVQPAPLHQLGYDWVRDRALLLGTSFHAVDLDDGTVTQLPAPATSSTPANCFGYDALNDRCYLLEYGNIVSGLPSKVSLIRTLAGTLAPFSDFVGAQTFDDAYLSTLDFDPVSGRIFAWSASSRSLFEILADGSRVVVSSPAQPTGSLVFGNSRGMTVLEGGDLVVIQEDSFSMTLIDTQTGSRSTQSFMTAPGTVLAASDGQGRVLLGDGAAANHTRGLLALDPQTLATESVFGIAPAVLPRFPSGITAYALDFDDLRGELVIGGVGLLCRIDPRTGWSSGQIGQLSSSIYDSVFNLFVDESRDRLLVDHRSADPLGQQGLYELDSQGENPVLLLPQVVTGPFPSLFRRAIAHDGVGGRIFDLSYNFPLPPGPFDLQVLEYDVDLNPLGQTMVAFPDVGFAAPIADPSTGLLYLAGSSTGALADVKSIDPTTGALQMVSPAGNDGVDLLTTVAHALLPETGEIAFADALRLVAIDAQTGARRLMAVFGSGFPGLQCRALARDPETGLLYVLLDGQVTVILAVDPVTGSSAQLAR